MNKKDKRRIFLKIQRDEINAKVIYAKLAKIIDNDNNRSILEQISKEEAKHCEMFRTLTGVDQKPHRGFASFIIFLTKTLGITFSLKLLERRERAAQIKFQLVIDAHPDLKQIMEDEEVHEKELLGMLEEERLEYIGSMVLGLNDALVELTGVLAGLTFAFRNTQLIALSGLITGIAASLSMASSEYLSHRAGGNSGKAKKAAVYTGIAYIITVGLLVLPYLLLANYLLALFLTMLIAVLIILIFNFYISVAKDLSFRRHFFEMAGLSFGVAALSFGIGIIVRKVLGVDI